MKYRNYTIQKGTYGFDYWKGDVDCEHSGSGWKSNVRSASSIEEARTEIDAEEGELHYVRVSRVLPPAQFNSFTEAVAFATYWNAELLTPIHSI